LKLLDNSGSTWMPGTLGTAATLQNAQCRVALASSSVSLSGTTLTLNLAMTFTGGFDGAKNVYLYARNSSGVNSGWHDRGDWTVPSSGVNVVSASPSSGSGAAQTFVLRYSDSAGATNLTQTWAFLTANFSNPAGTCMVYYDRPSARLYLLNSTGTAWTSRPLGSGTMSNEYCSVNAAGSSVSLSGTTLTLNLALTFTSNFSGTKDLYLFARNASANSGWQDMGDWIAP
jgi:hypothetical protein